MNKPISNLLVFSVVYCVVFRQKLKKTRRKHNKQKETNKIHENSKKNIKQTEIQDIQPSTRPRINISQVPAGRFLFFYCFSFWFFCFPSSLYVCFNVVICVFFDCKCKSLNKLGENIKQNRKKQKHNRTTQRKTQKQKQKYRISSPRPNRK